VAQSVRRKPWARAAAGLTRTRETNRLIASNKVDGHGGLQPAGDKLGAIYNFMVDKRSGQPT